MVDHTSFSQSSGRQNATSFVITVDAAIVQLHPVHRLMRLTTSVLVMIPAILPPSSQTMTRLILGPFSNRAASINMALELIAASRPCAVGKSLSTFNMSGMLLIFDLSPFQLSGGAPCFDGNSQRCHVIETGSLAGNVPSHPSPSNDAESGSAG
jgi:hypothetical protein